jgi:hypothetical protein
VMYDPETMQRLRAEDGSDHILLPVRIQGSAVP